MCALELDRKIGGVEAFTAAFGDLAALGDLAAQKQLTELAINIRTMAPADLGRLLEDGGYRRLETGGYRLLEQDEEEGHIQRTQYRAPRRSFA